jgi:hypothetical protein
VTPARGAAAVAIPIVVPRALLLWLLTRLAIAVLPLSIGGSFGSLQPHPFALVLLCGVVGLIDIRRRHEWILWANLGISPLGLAAIYATAAVPAEWVLALALR